MRGWSASFALGIFLLSGCGTGQFQDLTGVHAFQAKILEKRLYVSFTATELRWDQGAQFPIPGINDALVSFGPDLQSEGTVFQFSIPIATLAQQAKAYPPSGLPDGRRLPGVAGGILPRWDAKIGDINLSFYLAADAFAFFFPINLRLPKNDLSLPWNIDVPLTDERGNRVGQVTAVAPPTTGIYILVPLNVPKT